MKQKAYLLQEQAMFSSSFALTMYMRGSRI